MFLPETASQQANEDAIKRKAIDSCESLIMSLLSPPLRSDATIHVQEIICGDPSCAPIDTAVMVMFNNSGGRGQFGLPMEPKDVDETALQEFMPPPDIISEWHAGNSVDWSPYEDVEDEYNMDPTTLRFTVGQKVECRIGADPVTGWGKGVVVQVMYRESNWPPGQCAPYKIQLEDGRNIFAPQDVPEVIREAK